MQRTVVWADEVQQPLCSAADERTSARCQHAAAAAAPPRSALSERKRKAATAPSHTARTRDAFKQAKRIKIFTQAATMNAEASLSAPAAAVHSDEPDAAAAAEIVKQRLIRALQAAIARDPEAGRRLRQQKAALRMQQLLQVKRLERAAASAATQ